MKFLFLFLTLFLFDTSIVQAEESFDCKALKQQLISVYSEFGTDYGFGDWGLGEAQRQSHGMTACYRTGQLAHFNHCAVLKFPLAAVEKIAVLQEIDTFLDQEVGFSESVMDESYLKFLNAQAAGYDLTGRAEQVIGDYKIRFASWPARYSTPHEVCLMLTEKNW